MNPFYFLCFLLLFSYSCSSHQKQSTPESHSEIIWRNWSNENFKIAKEKKRLVLLDLKSSWCHWCHVMEQKTYSDPIVASTINKYYIPVRVEQDSHPALANRYKLYGWPATIIFTPDGKEILKNRGYVPPKKMNALLKKIYDNPVEQKIEKPIKYSQQDFLSKELHKKMLQQHRKVCDFEKGGFRFNKRFLDWDSIEYAFLQQNKEFQDFAILTLNQAQQLIDPVWGGMYQYSAKRSWINPHYEKLTRTQVNAIKAYALGYQITSKKEYKNAVASIMKYMQRFLMSDEGVFYTSQDADLIRGQKSHDYFALQNEERLKKGIPHVDKNVYARENGWMIEALAFAYEKMKEKKYLDMAIQTSNWILRNRYQDGKFFHNKDKSEVFLSDNLAMGKAFLQLYHVTAERKWLSHAVEIAHFLIENFQAKIAGFYTQIDTQSVIGATIDGRENILLARFYKRLHQYTRTERFSTASKHAMKYLTTLEIATETFNRAGILSLGILRMKDIPHLTVVGSKNDEKARALFRDSLFMVKDHKIIEWYDSKEGALPNNEIPYPSLPFPCVFLCANESCSAPMTTVEEIQELMQSE